MVIPKLLSISWLIATEGRDAACKGDVLLYTGGYGRDACVQSLMVKIIIVGQL